MFNDEKRLLSLFAKMAVGTREVIHHALKIADENRDYSPIEHFTEEAHENLGLICEVLDGFEVGNPEVRERVWL